ncbi:hypothetical protein [Mesomycoplasma ovipneumoniae]|uniref:hypothetical protein n=1 Tax=Mesomycoplasma ovipneumoniae TaxID=29562 RepID=UPI0029642247|nr:hypothetical protein [Mesomycoplasma ovipneumoniae]
MNQNNLLEKYKQQIEEISSKELNPDQKNLAIQILEKFEPSKLEYVFQFISQRIKTGFRFDAALNLTPIKLQFYKKTKHYHLF